MQKERQVVAQINAFLDSSDWTNSPVSREILAAYTECCVAANRRLEQCSMLLGSRKTAEAVNQAERDPSLFEIVPLLNFPRLAQFLELCDWYDWPMPPQLNMAVFEQLKSASSGMSESGLTELVTEYRRIARGGDPLEKVRLLRKIAALDPGNPEWRQNQKQLETELLPDLIDRAKAAIEQEDFTALADLQRELTHPELQIAVPEIVLEKIRRVLDGHRRAELRKRAAAILEEVNQAYSAFEQERLEKALTRWESLCGDDRYEPEPEELVQIEDAGKWLREKQREEAERQACAATRKRLEFLLDSDASRDEIEREYATLAAYEEPIPDYLADRMEMYRQLCESDERHRRILRTVKLIAVCAAGLLILGGVGYVVLSIRIENAQAEKLRAAIESGKLLEAQSVLKSIEENYPIIADGAKITELRGELSRMAYDINTRREDFLARIAEIDEELEKEFPDASYIESKFADCEKLVYFEEDRRALAEKREEVKRHLAAAVRQADGLFLEKIRELKEIRAGFFRHLGGHDYTRAEQMLERFREKAAEISALKSVSEESRREYAELLGSYGKLFEYFEEDKMMLSLISRLQQNVYAADTVSAVNEAVTDFEKSLGERSLQPSARAFVDALSGDSRALIAIMMYQEKPGRESIPQDLSVKFFDDARAACEMAESFDKARREMIAGFELLMANVIHNRLRMFSFRDHTGRLVVIYFPLTGNVSSLYDAGVNKLKFQSVDDRTVEISVDRARTSVRIGEDVYPDVRPVYPARLDRSALQGAIAPHQGLTVGTLAMLRRIDGVQLEPKIVDAIRKILTNPYCNPYWKLQLCSRLAGAMCSVRGIDTRGYATLKKSADELLGSDRSENGMENELLNDRIASELARLKIDELFRALPANRFRVRLIEEAVARKLKFLGVIQRLDGRMMFRKSRFITRDTGEVWCFDDKRSGCWLAGRFQGNEIIWNPEVRDRIGSCVVFTPEDSEDTAGLIAEFRKAAAEAGVADFRPPAFWPGNLTAGEK